MIQILRLRGNTESVPLGEDALKKLGEIGINASLRYCMGLIAPANILRKVEDKPVIEAKHIEEADALFMDAKTSAHRVAQQSNMFIS